MMKGRKLTIIRTITLVTMLLIPKHTALRPKPQVTAIVAVQAATTQVKEVMTVDSTSYCQSGTMADGQQTFVGAAAGNLWPFGTHLKLLSGKLAGTIVVVVDRIGWGSQLDLFTWSCANAFWYGRELIQVEVLGP